MEKILPLGILNFRGQEKKFGIKPKDRLKHIYIIGKTGQGKTTLLENMINFDIQKNNGLAFLDPHGDSVQKILDHIPKDRIGDVIYFNPTDVNHPIGFNPLEKVAWEQRHLTAISLLSVFKKIWIDAWSARMEYILTNTLLALLEWPKATLLDVNRMLADEKFRNLVINNLKDEVVKAFWLQEFSKYHLQFRTEAVAPIQNKIGQFITNPLIRNIIGQEESAFDLREIIDNGKIFLANLSVGAIGEETSRLLGGLLITRFQLAAMSRVDVPEEQRKDFYLYIDEFQNFATESFINILSEARKYHLSLVIANQYLDQVPEEIIKAIFGNIGTLIVFRVGAPDAEVFSQEFGSMVAIEDLTNLPSYHVYVKLLVDGSPTNPFLAKTLPPVPKPEISFKEEIINLTHLKYAKRRSLVEGRIARTYSQVKKEGEVVNCSNCRQPFLSQGESICEECQQRIKTGISLKKAAQSEIIIDKKNNIITDEKNLDQILKKLSNES
jgi:energy-coupling factor transporter ATP-binding protein EcfA2